MKPKVIKNDAEYQAALGEADRLMSAPAGSPEAGDLELWAQLIEKYEEAHFPIEYPDPISAIRFRMEQQGLKPADLIPLIGSKSKVSEVLNGKRPLSLSMIRRLHENLGIPAEVLIGKSMESHPSIAAEIDWKMFPLAEIWKRRWLGEEIASFQDLKNRAEKILRPFLSPVLAASENTAQYRRHVRSGGSVDEYALIAWKARVRQLALAQPISPYNSKSLKTHFIGEIARLSGLSKGPLLAAEYLAQAGIHLVIEPQMPQTYLDGAVLRFEGGNPIIALTLRYDRLDHFWFTLGHELAHVILHLKGEENASIMDDMEIADESEIEKEADREAAEAIISPGSWVKFVDRGNPTHSDICSFAALHRLHPAIVAGRYRKETNDFRIFSDLLGHRRVRALFAPRGN